MCLFGEVGEGRGGAARLPPFFMLPSYSSGVPGTGERVLVGAVASDRPGARHLAVVWVVVGSVASCFLLPGAGIIYRQLLQFLGARHQSFGWSGGGVAFCFPLRAPAAGCPPGGCGLVLRLGTG